MPNAVLERIDTMKLPQKMVFVDGWFLFETKHSLRVIEGCVGPIVRIRRFYAHGKRVRDIHCEEKG